LGDRVFQETHANVQVGDRLILNDHTSKFSYSARVLQVTDGSHSWTKNCLCEIVAKKTDVATVSVTEGEWDF